MTLAQAYGSKKFGLSFELFPPKTESGMTNLFCHVERFVAYKPSYITCTYGAGGSTQDKTLEVITKVRERYQLPVATHLTCVGLTAEQLGAYLQRAQDQGVENVVALRGDPPQGETEFVAPRGGFGYANELVEFIRQQFPAMGIAVGGYPETHQEAPSPEADLVNLKRKVDAGADAIITQLFFDNRDFFDFCDRCEQIGIHVPIVPGLLPITNGAQIQRLATLCGAKMPKTLVEQLHQHADDPQGQFNIGVEFATRQTSELLEAGVAGLHFYVLNKSEATDHVLRSVHWPR